MSIIYALVGTNRALRHSNSNNQIVIGDFNSFRFFWDTLYRVYQKNRNLGISQEIDIVQGVPKKTKSPIEITNNNLIVRI